MKQMDKLKSKLNSLSERGSFRRIIIVIGALGIALILFSDHLPFGRSTGGTQTRTAEAYAAELEKSLESFLSTVEGAGKTRVLLTMENSAETGDVANGAAKTKESEPRIRGVLVLCEGGDDPQTVARVSEAVTKALDISAAKVCIAKLSE